MMTLVLKLKLFHLANTMENKFNVSSLLDSWDKPKVVPQSKPVKEVPKDPKIDEFFKMLYERNEYGSYLDNLISLLIDRFASKDRFDDLIETVARQEQFVSLKYVCDLHSNELVTIKNNMDEMNRRIKTNKYEIDIHNVLINK